jgi:hypothetical protein
LRSIVGISSFAKLRNTAKGAIGKADYAHHGEKLAIAAQGLVDDLVDVSRVKNGEVVNGNFNVELSKLGESDHSHVQL